MTNVVPLSRRSAAFVVAAVVAVLGAVIPESSARAEQLPYPAPMQERTASTVSSDPLPTVQIDNGVVWSLAIVGNTVYAGGSFLNARPAGAAVGTNLTPRANLLAFDLRTGQLIESFAPSLNGQVKVVRSSPDGTRLYVGGSFTAVNGQTRFNIAAFSTATGELLSTFRPAVGGSYVNAIAATDTAVFVGGLISAGNGVARQNLMAFDTAGRLLDWAPTTNRQVDTMVMAPGGDKVVVGGRFTQVNGAPQRGMGALDPTTGAILPWIAPTIIQNGWNDGQYAGKAGIYSLNADADTVYGTGWVLGSLQAGNLEGSFAAEPGSGAIRWIEDCHGDVYDSYADGANNIYLVDHSHDCVSVGGYPQAFPAPGNMRSAQAFTTEVMGTLSTSPYNGTRYYDWKGWPAPAMRNWFPDFVTGSYTGQGQAAWTVKGSGDYLVAGGEFPYVNGKLQQGLVRFAREGVGVAGTGLDGPRLSGTNWVPTAVSVVPGTVRIAIPENWDRDDMALTYELRRNGASAPIATSTSSSTFWDRMTVAFKESGLTPGEALSYRVVARDPDGNTANSLTVNVSVATTPLTGYSQAVLADDADLYWRLGGGADTAAVDWADGNDGLMGTGVGDASSGVINGDAGTGSSYDGTNTGRMASSARVAVGAAFTLELWMRTTTTSGGKLIGYGNRDLSSTSSIYDRHIYMRNDGRLTFGVNPGPPQTITSPLAYNDGDWHHVAATLSASGMTLMVDGAVVASNPDVTTAQTVISPSLEPFVGYWRLGGDNLNGWPGQPSSRNFRGDLDEAAVYPTALSPGVLHDHYLKALEEPPAHQVPSATIGNSVDGLAVQFDGSASAAYDGATITGYAWDFGDGATSDEASPSHTYAADGTYDVSLVVTDSQGAASAPATASVTVSTPAHRVPSAAIGSSVDGLAVQFDGSASAAYDGATITGYAWDFGDGATSDEASPSHTYAADGTYDVSLVVTDSQGAVSAPATASVTVGTTVLVASDDFSESVASGWGTADVGGAWTTSSGFSVAGGKGLITSTAARQTKTAYLPGVSAQDVDARASLSLDRQVDGSGAHVNLALRRTDAGAYRLKLVFRSNGTVAAYLTRLVGSSETVLTQTLLPGTYAPGELVDLHFQVVTDGGSTTVQASAWPSSQAEPSGWLLTANDSEATLQGPGQVGVSTYLSSSVTTVPLVISMDDLQVGLK